MTILELSILTTLILKPQYYATSSSILKPEMFSEEGLATWLLISKEINHGRKPSVVRIESDLQSRNIEVQIVRHLGLSSSKDFEGNCEQLRQNWIRKEITFLAQDLVRDLEDSTDIAETLEAFDQEKSKLTYRSEKTSEKLGDYAEEIIENLDNPPPAGLVGTTTGFEELDKKLGGWVSPDQIIIAARPGMGKTELVLYSLVRAAMSGVAVGLFTIEMSARQVATRILSMIAEVSGMRIRNYEVSIDEKYKLKTASIDIKGMKFFVNQDLSSIGRIKDTVRTWANKGVKVVGYDYLQLISGSSRKGNREQEISEISRELKKTAKACGITNLLLSQLSRAVETRGGVKRPMLSDLRESGAIEQDADIVLFIYRPSYYDLADIDPTVSADLAELICAKNRHGQTFTANKTFRNGHWYDEDQDSLNENHEALNF